MNTPAGGGLEGTGEFIAITVVDESLSMMFADCHDELTRTRQVLRDIVYRVHNTYHGEGVAKPPWHKCHRTVCRQAQEILEVETEE